MKRYSPIKQKSAFWFLPLLAKGQMLVETGLDWSVWNFPAGKWNPGLNQDHPDGLRGPKPAKDGKNRQKVVENRLP